jgi:enoyl-CoA hydratase/carnithine racemase
MSTQENVNNREEGAVLLERTGQIATITLSRPGSLNALTWTMYQQLETHIDNLTQDETIRVVVIRGAGKAFAAGTDIAQFQNFDGQAGVRYEQKMDARIEKLYNFPKPLIAAIHGPAVGAGIILSSVCDLRYATPNSRFGAPMARTLGNTLSLKNYRHLAEAFGTMRAREMLFTARLLSAQEALQCGFLTAIFDEEQIFPQVFEIARQISTFAPLTIWAAKEADRRMHVAEKDIAFDDVVERVYGSADFAEGVKAHIEKRKPQFLSMP